jgi:hypothetical protein
LKFTHDSKLAKPESKQNDKKSVIYWRPVVKRLVGHETGCSGRSRAPIFENLIRLRPLAAFGLDRALKINNNKRIVQRVCETLWKLGEKYLMKEDA